MSFSAATLPKEERLHGKKDISRLLDSGKWGSAGCIRYCFIPNDSDCSRLMVSVPKRFFKKAVKRNLLKRRIREAYRRGKPQQAVDILLQYTGDEVLPFAQIKQDVNAAIEKISK
jgi:ribonuclease P protein component